MLRFFIPVLILTSFCFSSPLDLGKKEAYATTYKDALYQANKNNMPIMAIFVTKMCPWCKKLENQTLKKPKVASFIKANFIPLVLDKEEAKFPKRFTPEVVPTTVFIQADKEKKISQIVGYKPADEYLKLLEKAKNHH